VEQSQRKSRFGINMKPTTMQSPKRFCLTTNDKNQHKNEKCFLTNC